MKITFLGTGGGRFVMYRQLLGTGGFIIEIDNEMIHVDPGPGATLRAKMYGIDLEKLTGVFVSHAHSEHDTEAGIVIEAMSFGGLKRNGFLVAGKTVIKNTDTRAFRSLSPFHLKSVDTVKALFPGEYFSKNSIKVMATPTQHGDPNNIGFVLKGKEKTIGYTSDTLYIEKLEKHFEGCEILILNMTYGKAYPKDVITLDHLRASDVSKIIKHVKPEIAILTHFGLEIHKERKKEAKRIRIETGIKTIAAEDGQIFNF